MMSDCSLSQPSTVPPAIKLSQFVLILFPEIMSLNWLDVGCKPYWYYPAIKLHMFYPNLANACSPEKDPRHKYIVSVHATYR